ncbi:MAG: hypothetical protein IJK73_07005 [Bacteroidales bacterium]|nr:hypothetical protein [Bacteroidales bacterium]
MERLNELKPVYCDTFPETFKPGELYISHKYHIAGHLCLCGCGNKSILPLRPHNPKGWSIAEKDGKVTLRASVLNVFCGSHYFITDNKIEWL